MAKETGITPEQYAALVGGEGYGAGIELASDFLLSPLASKLTQFAVGLGLGLGAIFGKPSPRVRLEMAEISSHNLFRLLDPKPEDFVAVRSDIDKLVAGITKGDLNAVKDALVRDPTKTYATLAVAFAPPGAARGPASVPPFVPPTSTPPAPATAPAAPSSAKSSFNIGM